MEILFDDFLKVDIRTGTIISAKVFEGARKPAYQLEIDFGLELGIKRSSAQITVHYSPQDLIGKQIIAVVNFPKKQIANFFSEVLVLGIEDSSKAIVLMTPDQKVANGQKLL